MTEEKKKPLKADVGFFQNISNEIKAWLISHDKKRKNWLTNWHRYSHSRHTEQSLIGHERKLFSCWGAQY